MKEKKIRIISIFIMIPFIMWMFIGSPIFINGYVNFLNLLSGVIGIFSYLFAASFSDEGMDSSGSTMFGWD